MCNILEQTGLKKDNSPRKKLPEDAVCRAGKVPAPGATADRSRARGGCRTGAAAGHWKDGRRAAGGSPG